MFEIALIVAINALVFWRTIFFSVIVDDVRWLETLQIRNYTFPKLNLNFFPSLAYYLHNKLYGAGTFSQWKKCTMCDGKGEISIGPDKEHAQVHDCPRCKKGGHVSFFHLPTEHVFQTVLHTAICCLIYLALGHNKISFLAAILYAINPTNTQTSIWLNGRRYAVNIILTLLIVLFGPIALPLYIITPIFQGNSIFAPVLLGGWWILVIPAVVALNWKRFTDFYHERMKTIVNEDMHEFSINRAIVVIKTFGFYTAQMIFPIRTMMIYRFLHAWGLSAEGNKDAYRIDRYFWIGLASLVATIGSLFVLKGHEFYWMLFMILSLGQWCNILTPTQTAADRYVSMANVFMMYFLSKILDMTGILAGPIASAFIVFYLANLFTTMKMFNNIEDFYDYHNYWDPANITARKFEINWKMKARDPMAAWQLIKKGLQYNPKDFTLNYQAAVCMNLFGDFKKSEDYFDIAAGNHYINQEPIWRSNIEQIRSVNRKNLTEKSAEGSRIIHPGGNGHKIMNFARGKRK